MKQNEVTVLVKSTIQYPTFMICCRCLLLWLLLMSTTTIIQFSHQSTSSNNNNNNNSSVNNPSFIANTIVGYDRNGNNLPGIYANLNPTNMSINVGNNRILMYDSIRSAIIQYDLKTQIISTVYSLSDQTVSILEISNGILFSDIKGMNIKLLSNNQVTIFAGLSSGNGYSGDGVATEKQLNYPRSLLDDGNGNIYFIDFFNYRVRKISGNRITTIAGDGKNENDGDGSSASRSSLKNPSGLTLYGNNLYILCGVNTIRRVDLVGGKIYRFNVDTSSFTITGMFTSSNGTMYVHSGTSIGIVQQPSLKVTVIAGSESRGAGSSSENNIPAMDARFKSVTSIGVLSSSSQGDSVYICDISNGDIRVINETNYIHLVAGVASFKSEEQGFPIPYFFTEDPTGLVELGKGGDFAFSYKYGIGRLYNTGHVTQLLASQNPILGLAYYEKEDELYFSEPSKIQKLKNGQVIHVAGVSHGQEGDNILATLASLSTPFGLAINQQNGDLYFTDRAGNRVRKISNNDGILTTIAGNGQADYSGDNGNSTMALVNSPSGIFYTENNEIFFVDSGNARIRKISNGIITTVAGSNECNAKKGSNLAIETILKNPTFVYVYSNGDFLITETNSHVVRRVSNNGIISTIAGTGLSGEGEDGIPALQSTLQNPSSIIHSTALKQILLVDKTNRVRSLTASSCGSGYVLDSTGAHCLPYCFGFLSNDTDNVCSGKGKCSSFNSCNCIASYGGEECNTVKCYGILATDTNVCRGRGECLEGGICDCGVNYGGSNCENPYCFGISSNASSSAVCGGHGKCTDFNTCECTDKYSGESCMHATCFGIAGTSSSVCNGRGKCISPDVCQCHQGSSGTVCETSIEELDRQNRERTLIIVGSVIGAAIVLLCCIVWTVSVFLCTNRKLKQRMIAERDMEKKLLEFEFDSLESGTIVEHSPKSYIIPLSEITFVKKIGAGGFSNVYLGKWQQSNVAVKSVEMDQTDETFEQEAQTLCAIKHPNIITFFGISFSDTRRLLIVEYFEKGSLDRYISDLAAKKIKCSLKQKIRYLLHIANGMVYLHAFKPNPIIHRDLKPANILLSENGLCKICDFGLSRTVSFETKSAMTCNIGTFYYCSNEMLDGTNQKQYATAIDVYSFSIIAWELLFEEPNPYEYSNTSKMLYSMEEDVALRYSKLSPFNVPSLVSKGLRPPIPFTSTESCKNWCEVFAENIEKEQYLVVLQLSDLIKRCWDERPEHRPSFVEIVKILSQLEGSFASGD